MSLPALLAAAALASPAGLRPVSLEDQQTDLDTLRQHLEEQHPGLTLYTDRAALDAAFAEVRASLAPDATGIEVWADLLPLVALVGCTHTELRTTESLERDVGDATFPLDLVVSADRLWVDPRAHPGPPRELVSVEGTPAAELLAGLRARAPADGLVVARKDAWLDEEAAHVLTGMLGPRATWTLETRTGGGAPVAETLPGVGWGDVPEPRAPRRRPFVDARAEGRVLVVPVPDFAESDAEGRRRVAALRRRAAEADVLVLDLRGNGGGSTTALLDLWSLFAWRTIQPYPLGWARRADRGWPPAPPAEMPPGTPPGVFRAAPEDLYAPVAPDPDPLRLPVVVVTDATTVSSGSDLAYFFQSEGRAALVGSETASGRWLQNCESYGYHLLYRSHLYVRIPEVSLATADVAGRGHGVVPATVVVPTIEDLAAGRDPVLDRAIARARELLR